MKDEFNEVIYYLRRYIKATNYSLWYGVDREGNYIFNVAGVRCVLIRLSVDVTGDDYIAISLDGNNLLHIAYFNERFFEEHCYIVGKEHYVKEVAKDIPIRAYAYKGIV